jgi:AcrR family transcriptional regulator
MKTSPNMQKRPAGRRPRSAHPSSDTRSQILAAARCVFARRGFAGASVRDVAETARVNNAMIYYHFKDKVELYRAVLSDSFAAFDRIWDHEIFNTSADARAKIGKYIEELIGFQHANEDLRRILSMEFACGGQNITWLAENLFDNSYQKLIGILKDGMRRGELKHMDLNFAIASLIGMVIHTFIMKPVVEHMTGKTQTLSVNRFGAFVTGMFFDGLAEQAPAATIRVRTRRVT